MRQYVVQRNAPTAEPLSLTEAKLHLSIEDTDSDVRIATLITAARQYGERITRRAFVAQRWTSMLDAFPRPGFNIGSANWYGPQWGINPGPLTVLSPDGQTGYEIYLPFAPTMFVESIQYYDTTSPTGILQTLDPSQYQLDLSEPACLTPSFGNVWPQTQQQKGAVIIKFSSGFVCPITATAATPGTISAPIWPTLAINSVVRLSNTGGALPAPLQPATDYYVQSVVSPGVYTLSSAPSGSAITLTTVGTGTSFIGEMPQSIMAWLKIRMGTLNENREEVALLNRGKIELLPYVDNLLDNDRVLTF